MATKSAAAKKAPVKKAAVKKAPAEKAAPAAPKKLRVAIIGCGGISQTHMAAYKEIPEVELVGFCDINPAKLTEYQEKYGVKPEQCFEKWDDLFKAVKPDAVDICTPNGVHCPAALAAAAAGCHIMVEKPMAMNPDECEQMIAAAKKHKVKLAVGFQHRHGLWDLPKGHQEAGEDIKVTALHVVEMAHYFMGSPKPVAATGNCWTYLGNKQSDVMCAWPNWDYKTYTVEDLAIGGIRFDNGRIMQIESSFGAQMDKDEWRFTAMGDKGGCCWDPLQIFTDEAGAMVHITPDYVAPDWNKDWVYLFVRKLQNWVDGILKGTPLRASGEEGLAVQKILDGIYRSAEQGGKEVPIK